MMKLTTVILISLWLVNVADADEYKHMRMADWKVLVAERASNDKAALGKLESTLKELNGIFPPRFLPVLHRVPIQLEGQKQEHGTRVTGYYQPSPMVIANGVARPTGPGKVHLMSDSDCGNKILLVHELSHAAQNLTVGYDNPRIKKAYQAVVEKKLYPTTPYLMTNDKEFFAEMSVVYLWRLHYFPHDRATLKKHDPATFKVMEDFWGKPPIQKKQGGKKGN